MTREYFREILADGPTVLEVPEAEDHQRGLRQSAGVPVKEMGGMFQSRDIFARTPVGERDPADSQDTER